MDPSYSLKTAFISNQDNYYYNIMPFGLKNDGTTYQRLMDVVFLYHIGWNLEVYIKDMIINNTEGEQPCIRFEDAPESIRKYSMRLNPAKCSFGVQVGKFLGFMLTKRDIKANLDKFQAFITMRSPTNVKEVQ